MHDQEKADAPLAGASATANEANTDLLSSITGERDTLKHQVSNLAKEVVAVNQAHRNVVKSLTEIQGLLYQMYREEVRLDFIGGKFGVVCCSQDMLTCLDLIRSAVMPCPSLRESSGTREPVFFISKLFSDDPGEPLVGELPLPITKSWGEWRVVLGSLLASEYWTTARNLSAGGGYKVPDGSDRAKIEFLLCRAC